MAKNKKTILRTLVEESFKELKEEPKPDFLDLDGDGDKKEPMKKAAKDKKNIKEADIEQDGSKFTLRTGVNKNPTKLGIKIQFEPQEGFLDTDKKSALEVALQEKLNDKLAEYDIQVSKDTDVPREDVIGFFIPLSQIKNLIVQGITGSSPGKPTVPAPGPDNNNKPPIPKPPAPKPPTQDDDKEDIEEQFDLSTGFGMKDFRISQETTGGVSELYKKVDTLSTLIEDVFKTVNDSDFDFKDYAVRNEEHITRTVGIIGIIKDELEDRLENEEPVGPDQGIEEVLKKTIRKQITEMRVRDLNEASKIVIKEDFYGFINAGNNIIRTFEENGKSINEAKKYMKYLLQHNIM